MKLFKLFLTDVLIIGLLLASNPFQTGVSGLIDFSQVDTTTINEARLQVIAEAKKLFAGIYTIPEKERTWENSLLAIDDILSRVYIIYSVSDLLANTHPDKGVRDASNAGLSIFGKFLNEVNMDLDLYRSVKEFSQLPAAKALTGYKAKYLKETIRDFERKGREKN
jgi:Zn-dependent oligopeptidase